MNIVLPPSGLIQVVQITTSPTTPTTTDTPDIPQQIPPGSYLTGIVLGRSEGGFTLRTQQHGDIALKTDAFLRTGSEIVLKFETQGGQTAARIVTIDGKQVQSALPQEAGDTPDALLTTSTASKAIGVTQAAEPRAQLLPAILLNAAPAALPYLRPYLPPEQKLAADSPVKLLVQLLFIGEPDTPIPAMPTPAAPNAPQQASAPTPASPTLPATSPLPTAPTGTPQAPAGAPQLFTPVAPLPATPAPVAPTLSPAPATGAAPAVSAPAPLPGPLPGALPTEPASVPPSGYAAYAKQSVPPSAQPAPSPLAPAHADAYLPPLPIAGGKLPELQPQPMIGTIIQSNPGEGEALVQTPIGTMKILIDAPLPKGSQVQLLIHQVVPSAPGGETPLPAPLPETARFPELSALFSLPKGAEALPLTAAALAERLPMPGHKFATNALFLLSALKGDGMLSWLQPAGAKMDKRDMVVRIGRELMENMPVKDSEVPLGWHGFHLPVWDGEALKAIRFLYHRQQQGEGGEGKAAPEGMDERFILDLELSELGQMRFDGLVKTREQQKYLDLILRSQQVLSSPIQQEIRRIFEEGEAITGIKGSLQFAVSPSFPLIEPPKEGAPISARNWVA